MFSSKNDNEQNLCKNLISSLKNTLLFRKKPFREIGSITHSMAHLLHRQAVSIIKIELMDVLKILQNYHVSIPFKAKNNYNTKVNTISSGVINP